MVIPLILLVVMVTTPRMITEDVFAIYQRHTGASNLNQAASITNSCLNPVSNSNTNDNMISNGNCGGTISQQGKSGQASSPTTVQSASPSIEVQRSTSTQSPITGPRPTSCTQCFDLLNATQQQAANQILVENDPLTSPIWPPGITTLEELCNAWGKFTMAQRNAVLGDISSFVNQLPVDSATQKKIFDCMLLADTA
jgi:hypothetical protein